MLNINITKKKFNKLLISTNRLIESFFNNLSSNIKEYKKKSSIYKKINNRAFLVFGSLLFLSLTYFLIPSFFDKNSVKLKLEQIIKDQYNIQIKFVDDISYSLFPKPHFYANNLNIFQDDNILINSKNTKISISIISFIIPYKHLLLKIPLVHQHDPPKDLVNLPLHIL